MPGTDLLKRLAAAVVCVLLTSCVYSLEPFYSKESLVASPVAVRVGGATFVDTYPRDPSGESPSEAYWSIHRAPFHLLTRLEVSADRIVARPMAASARFRELSRQAAFASRVAERGDYLTFVTGATPADWKAFLEKHGGDPALFSEKGQLVFTRLKE